MITTKDSLILLLMTFRGKVYENYIFRAWCIVGWKSIKFVRLILVFMERVLWIDSTDEDYILWRFVLWYLRSTNESFIWICNAGELWHALEMFSMK